MATASWLHPKKPSRQMVLGWRTWFSWVLIAIMFAGPWIRINGNPLLHDQHPRAALCDPRADLLAAGHRHLRRAMLVFITSIIIFTTAFGRLWCGWACPQTVMMEMVFRKIEYSSKATAARATRVRRRAVDGEEVLQEVQRSSSSSSSACPSLLATPSSAYIVGSEKLSPSRLDDPRNHICGT
jgi:hypothetical protein